MAYRPIKPFLTYDQQVDNLRDNKKLIIKDRGKALETLKDIRYFSLIDGYKDFFYDPMTRTYKDGASFDDIVALYDFDEELRYIMFRYIERIEQKMRSLISYNFCRRYSVNQKDYLNIACYDDQKKNHNGILKLISILDHIPEKILDAFVEEVVVYKERFVWKLNFSDEGITCFFSGNKRNPKPAMVMDSVPLDYNSGTGSD